MHCSVFYLNYLGLHFLEGLGYKWRPSSRGQCDTMQRVIEIASKCSIVKEYHQIVRFSVVWFGYAPSASIQTSHDDAIGFLNIVSHPAFDWNGYPPSKWIEMTEHSETGIWFGIRFATTPKGPFCIESKFLLYDNILLIGRILVGIVSARKEKGLSKREIVFYTYFYSRCKFSRIKDDGDPFYLHDVIRHLNWTTALNSIGHDDTLPENLLIPMTIGFQRTRAQFEIDNYIQTHSIDICSPRRQK